MAAIWNRVNTVLLLLVLFALLAVVGMLAADVRGGPLDPLSGPGETDSVRLPGTPIDGPAEITEPGHYYLTRNISIPSGGVGVQISTTDVTLDLGGFSIFGLEGDEVGVSAINHARIRISNGTIHAAEKGIDANSTNHVEITGVSAIGNNVGFIVSGDTVIEDCAASRGVTGIEINGVGTTVRGCVIESNQSSGVVVNGGANAVLIEDSAIKSNNTSLGIEDAGIRLYFNTSDATVRNNDMTLNGVADVLVSGADHVIVKNIVSCQTSILATLDAVNMFAPVNNTTDPHTNRAHRPSC